MKTINNLLTLAIFTLVLTFAFSGTNVAWAQQQTDYQEGETNKCTILDKYLSIGSRDANTQNQVSSLQFYLNGTGYLDSDPTGYFGSMTDKAVKAFQSANGITANGYVGPVTRAKIKELSCGGVYQTPSSSVVSPSAAVTLSGQCAPGTVSWTDDVDLTTIGERNRSMLLSCRGSVTDSGAVGSSRTVTSVAADSNSLVWKVGYGTARFDCVMVNGIPTWQTKSGQKSCSATLPGNNPITWPGYSTENPVIPPTPTPSTREPITRLCIPVEQGLSLGTQTYNETAGTWGTCVKCRLPGETPNALIPECPLRITPDVIATSSLILPDLTSTSLSPATNTNFTTIEPISFTGTVQNSETAPVVEGGWVDLEIDWGRDGGAQGPTGNTYDVSFATRETRLGTFAPGQIKSLSYTLPGGVAPVGEHRYRFNVDNDGTGAVESSETNNRSAWIDFTVSAATKTTPRLIICPAPQASVSVGGTADLSLRYWADRSSTPDCDSTGYTIVNNGADWSSNDTFAATVNNTTKKGQITGGRLGWGATIKANYSVLSATRPVSVVGAPNATGQVVAVPDVCGSGKMIISWAEANHATEYTLYDWAGDKEIYRGPNTTFTQSGLALGSSHMYYVKVKNAAGASEASVLSPVAIVAGSCSGSNLEIGSIIADTVIKPGDSKTIFGTFSNLSATPITNTFTNRFSYRLGTSTDSSWNLLSDRSRNGFTAKTVTSEQTKTFTFTDPGFIQVKYCLDVDNVVKESNETDNCTEALLYVTPHNATPQLLICSAADKETATVGSATPFELRFWGNSTTTPDCSTTGYTTVTKSGFWDTDRASIATVSRSEGTRGWVTGVAEGAVTIKASYSGYTASKTVQVESVGNKPRLRICPVSPEVSVGGVTSLELRYWSVLATVPDCDTTGYTVVTTNSGTSWSSSNTKVATISRSGTNKGQITGVALGSTIIRASYAGLSFERSLSVKTADQPDLVPSATIGQTEGLLVRGATGVKFSAQVRNNTTITTAADHANGFSYRWSTTSDWISLTPNSTRGLLSGEASHQLDISPEVPLLQAGTLYVRYCVDINNDINENPAGEVNNCTTTEFTVLAVAKPHLIICPRSPVIPVGGTAKLTAHYWASRAVTPACTDVATATTVTNSTSWASQNVSLVSVNNTTNKGLVTGLAAGSATLKATYLGLNASNVVQVAQAPTVPPHLRSQVQDCGQNTKLVSLLVSWDAPAGATEYSLRRDGVEIYRGHLTSYLDDKLSKNTRYRYDVMAMNVAGNSSYSTVHYSKSASCSGANLKVRNLYSSYAGPLLQGESKSFSGSFGNVTLAPVSTPFTNRFSYRWVGGAWNTLSNHARKSLAGATYPGENSTNLSLSKSGYLNIKYQVDVDNTISESSETDNVAELMLYVTGPNDKPQLIICPEQAKFSTKVVGSLELRFWSNNVSSVDCNSAGYTVVTNSADWSSNSTGVAVAANELGRKGLVTGVSVGVATITAKYSGYTASRLVTVGSSLE